MPQSKTKTQFKKLTAEDIAYFESIMDPERVLTGEDISEDLPRDEMTEYGTFDPEVVLTVLSTEEVSKIMAYCYEHTIPVTPRGAGTGLCGCVPIHGGVVLNLAEMDRLLEVDPINMTATVEAGLLLMEFAKLLRVQASSIRPIQKKAQPSVEIS